MNKLFFGIIGLVIMTVSFSSCTVEKRVHQDGYHISWKHRHLAPSELIQITEISSVEEVADASEQEIPQPNVHSVESISANSNEDNALILLAKKSPLFKSKNDTIVPDQPKQQEEYFSNNYVSPEQTQDIRDQQLANWALGLGIASVSTPIWATILFLSIGAAAGFSWALLGVSVLIGVALFLALEITAITFAIRFLRRRGTDPEYRKYRSRAITGLVLAGIYPALMVINIILALVLAI